MIIESAGRGFIDASAEMKIGVCVRKIEHGKVNAFLLAPDTAAASNPPKSPRAQDMERLKQVAQDMESLLVKQMLDAMRKSIEKTKFIDGGMAEDIFQDMRYDEYAKTMSKTKSFGIAGMIVSQYSRYI